MSIPKPFMALTPEEIWDHHKDSLQRIRLQLHKPGTRQNGKKGGGRRVSSVSPANTPPPRHQLPQIHTPPGHDDYRHSRDLRGSRRDVVPPVRRRVAFERESSAGDDSWGEASDEDENYESVMPQPMAYPYPYPPYPYAPVFYHGYPLPPGWYQPPRVGPGPSPRPLKSNIRRKNRKDRDRRVMIDSRPKELRTPVANGVHEKQKTGTHRQQPPVLHVPPDKRQKPTKKPVPELREEPEPSHNENDPVFRNNLKKRYPHLYYGTNKPWAGRATSKIPAPSNRYEQRNHRTDRYDSNLYERDPRFRYISSRPYESDDESAYSEYTVSPQPSPVAKPRRPKPAPRRDQTKDRPANESPDNPYFSSAAYVSEEFVQDQVKMLIREIVGEVTRDLADGYIRSREGRLPRGEDPLEDFLNDLVDDAIRENARETVREAVNDLAQTQLQKAAVWDAMMDTVTEYVTSEIEDMAVGVMQEVVVEDIIESEVVGPVLSDLAGETSTEVLQYYDDKLRKRQLLEISERSIKKPADIFLLDYLLRMVAQQGEMWTEEEFRNKVLDSFITDELLTQFLHVRTKRREPSDNYPIRRLHEKMTADVGLDILLKELCQFADEDMEDFDEYELGLEVLSDPVEW